MDDLARYNKERWEELARHGVLYSRPRLNLTPQSARTLIDPQGQLLDPAGKDVLCLAAGGGQQSAAFGVLGAASITALDLSETMLERDRLAADHYGHKVRTVQGDMRDLRVFGDARFDIVWHGHSLNFIPDLAPVYDEVARVLRPGGHYRTSCWNPFGHGVCEDGWTGKGYLLSRPYVEGEPVVCPDDHWEFPEWQGWLCRYTGETAADATAPIARVRGPKEFRHTIGALVNGLIQRGLTLLGLWEEDGGEATAQPGTWDYFRAFVPPWVSLLACRDAREVREHP